MQGEHPAFLAIWYSVKLYHIEIGTIISSERCILCKPHSARHSLSPQTSEYHNNNLHADYRSLLYSCTGTVFSHKTMHTIVIFNNTILIKLSPMFTLASKLQTPLTQTREQSLHMPILIWLIYINLAHNDYFAVTIHPQ